MKRKKSILWIVMIIAATTLFTSCRYENGATVAPNYLSRIVWQEMPDSTKSVLNQVLDSLGPKRLHTEIPTGEVILFSKIEGSKLSEEVIDRIPFYLTMKFGDITSPIIVERETESGQGKTWLRNDQKIFNLVLIDKDFRKGKISIEETSFDLWIIFIMVLFIMWAAALYHNKNYGGGDKRITIDAIVAGICLLILWFNVAYIISLIASIISIIIFVYSFLKEEKD